MRLRRKKEHPPYQIVRDLKVEEGRAILITLKPKKGREITVTGALKGQHLIVPPGSSGNSRDCCMSYGPGTQVQEWKALTKMIKIN